MRKSNFLIYFIWLLCWRRLLNQGIIFKDHRGDQVDISWTMHKTSPIWVRVISRLPVKSSFWAYPHFYQVSYMVSKLAQLMSSKIEEWEDGYKTLDRSEMHVWKHNHRKKFKESKCHWVCVGMCACWHTNRPNGFWQYSAGGCDYVEAQNWCPGWWLGGKMYQAYSIQQGEQ